MRPGINRVGDDLIFIMPDFIHEFGDDVHHWSMTRTCDFNEDEAPIPGTGPSNLRYWLHKLLDAYIFYPLARWIDHWVGDNDLGQLLRQILGFFWGLNCGFPARDVALYTVWTLRGCKAIAVFKKIPIKHKDGWNGLWTQTY